MKRSPLKRFLLLLAGLFAVAAAPDKASQDPPGMVTMTAEQQHTVKLQTALVTRQAITEPIRVPATIGFDIGHVAVLRPLAPARVLRLLVAPGDRVNAGQALARLQIPSLVDAEERLASARSSLQEASAGVAVARDALRRGEILARDGSLARAEAERRRLVLAQAQATEASARNQISALLTQVAQLDPGGANRQQGDRQLGGGAALVAPIAGVVASLDVTPGEFVAPETNAITIADLSVVVALAQVPEASAALVAVGDPVQVRQAANSGRVWDGRVGSLGAALDPQARTLPVRITLDNADGALRAGMFVEATITSNRQRDGMVVPAAAVQFLGDKQVAFTPAGDGRFQSHALTLGVVQKDWMEVRRGLVPDEAVVTDGSFALKALLQERMAGGG